MHHGWRSSLPFGTRRSGRTSSLNNTTDPTQQTDGFCAPSRSQQKGPDISLIA